jgi:hypothetical protein
VPSYPGWSRVIVTHNDGAAERLREAHNLDTYQAISFREWTMMTGVNPATEVAIDNADMILRTAMRSRGRIVLAAFKTDDVDAGSVLNLPEHWTQEDVDRFKEGWAAVLEAHRAQP